MKKTIFYILTFSIAFMMTSCDFGVKKHNNRNDIKQAEKVTGWYYYHLMNKNFDSIYPLISDLLWDYTSEKEFKKALSDMDSIHGKIEVLELLGAESINESKFGGGGIEECRLLYKVVYRDLEMTHEFFVHKVDFAYKIHTVNFYEK